LILLALLTAWAGFRQEPHFGWRLAGAIVLGTWLGWMVRQLWIYPSNLAHAETRWAEGAPASEVAEILSHVTLATGELGYRVNLLRGAAHASLGYRDRAWLDFLEAQLVRLPWWKRLVVSRAFGKVPGAPSAKPYVVAGSASGPSARSGYASPIASRIRAPGTTLARSHACCASSGMYSMNRTS